MGRNGEKHHESRRGMGSGIRGKFLGDNDGKVLYPTGMTIAGKDQAYRVKPKESGGFRTGA